MKYEEIYSQSVAKGTLRVLLQAIYSTKYQRGIVGYSVRLQRNYDGLWMPVGRRLCYGRNAFDFGTKARAEEFFQHLIQSGGERK